jgi:anti-anti-sigma factor
MVGDHDLRTSPPPLQVSVSADGGRHVVNVSGELDMGTRDFVEEACLAGDDMAVVVEMAELTFMDCRGYGALVEARRVLQERGGSLTLSNHVGQPARLLMLLGAVEPV